MDYLKDHAPLKENPKKLLSRAHSALVFTQNYVPHPYSEGYPLKALKVALYAKGKDYHHWFKKKLSLLCERLKSKMPSEEFLAFTDSSPVLEKDLAQQAGLGWFGKNTCLIHPKKGSLFFIGEIYTSLKLEPVLKEISYHCGTCTRCIDACPTQAFIEPFKLDAGKCISYLTIESKNLLPKEDLRVQIGDWFFGCDLCQTVCPWNQKIFTQSLKKVKKAKYKDLIDDLRFILQSSHKKLQKTFSQTALSRARPKALKRNALIVTGNLKLHELRKDVLNLSSIKDFSELARWTLKQMDSL